MFAKSIVESDAFLDMPAEAQMLYIHLNLAADDDGFCDNPRSVMRQCGASNDSMKLLVAKKFVLTFDKKDNFIVVIKHWRMNNYIRKDNYRETKYKEFMRELYYDENRSYSMNPDDGHKPCLPRTQSVDEPYTDRTRAVDEPLTQDRIGKDSIGKVSLEEGKDRDRKGEPERETQLDLLSADERKAKIKFWKERIDFMRSQNFDAGGMYNLAKAKDGITMEEIDSYREENTNG